MRDAVHRGVNWTTLGGVVITAALGWQSDQQKSNADETIKHVLARELSELHEWKRNAAKSIDHLTQQVGMLREASAGAKATLELLARGRRDRSRVLAAAQGVTVSEPLGPLPADPEVDLPSIEAYKSELFQKGATP
jgi:hypothetical protein